MRELVVKAQNGTTFVFITRDEAEPFTLQEAQEYLSTTKLSFSDKPISPPDNVEFNDEELVSGWHIPDDKMRRHIFRKDLQIGMDFCMKKYGQPLEVIQAEARRLGAGGF